ncbi:plus-3 domain protein (macronuclear) [Tetrahymena thermophila SB210]|uniref:Plus-3 domain protein n=1 Tax=Tetrahymena thermophila (strain SB210) TaxID=312017 RepID=I7M9Q1_TETTS|nr:plus-3 domain protein [Tetrahymena thermophila SB210]EAS02456.1 plus-3 domain protein [Tetrahymena thermophila SB210]|eukprot:XP_001022701.1 plus-3 domain protein [Tetrahymena thermophila SB210]
MDTLLDKKDINANDKDLLKKKKKNTFSQKEVFSDGYDTDGYKDEEDRKKLNQMNEVDRVNELNRRLEERNNKKFDDKIAEKAEKVKTTAGAAVASNIFVDPTNGLDQSKKSQVEKDKMQLKKELETKREKLKDSNSHSNNNNDYNFSQYDDFKSQTHGLAQHQRERNTQSEEFQKLVKQLTLSKDYLNKLLLRSYFHELVKGVYVKVRIGTKYEIYKIEGAHSEGNNTVFTLNNGLKTRKIDLQYISNQNPDQVELCTYYEQNKHEKLQSLVDKKKQFDDLINKKQEKSEKQKYQEIDQQISQKIEQGYYEKQNNLNANEIQTNIGFYKDRILDIDYIEQNQIQVGKSELEKLQKDKVRFQKNVEYLQKQIKLVKHQIVPIFTKNVLEMGSKISEQALNKKNAKIKDKAMIRRQKIQKLQQPYFAFEEQFKQLSQYSTSILLKEIIKNNHSSLHLSSQIQKDLSLIDCSDQTMQSLISNKK